MLHHNVFARSTQIRGGRQLPNFSENPNNVWKWAGGLNACSDWKCPTLDNFGSFSKVQWLSRSVLLEERQLCILSISRSLLSGLRFVGGRGSVSTTLDKKKKEPSSRFAARRTLFHVWYHARSGAISAGQKSRAVADRTCPALIAPDQAWYHTWNSVLLAANLDDGSFFLARVVDLLRRVQSIRPFSHAWRYSCSRFNCPRPSRRSFMAQSISFQLSSRISCV